MRLVEGRHDGSNPQDLYKNLNDASQVSLKKIQRYCEEYTKKIVTLKLY